MLFAAIGIVLTLGGATALYAAAPHQKLLAATLPPRRCAMVGALLMAAGLGALLTWAGPATAIFISLTMAMLAFSFVPVAVAWLRHRKEQR